MTNENHYSLLTTSKDNESYEKNIYILEEEKDEHGISLLTKWSSPNKSNITQADGMESPIRISGLYFLFHSEPVNSLIMSCRNVT